MATILLLEDDNLLAKEMMATFADAKFEAVRAKNAEEAFALLEKENISLMFLDVMLNGSVDGFTILHQIKSNPKHAQIPAVMLTNLSTLEKMDRATELGAVDYIIKANIDIERLVDLARKYLVQASRLM